MISQAKLTILPKLLALLLKHLFILSKYLLILLSIIKNRGTINVEPKIDNKSIETSKI